MNQRLLFAGMTLGLAGAAAASGALLKSPSLVGVAGALGLLGAVVLVDGVRSVRLPPGPPDSNQTARPSVHSQKILVPHYHDGQRVCCARCKHLVRREREGDECWLAVRRRTDGRTTLVHFHLSCADEQGEPLP